MKNSTDSFSICLLCLRLLKWLSYSPHPWLQAELNPVLLLSSEKLAMKLFYMPGAYSLAPHYEVYFVVDASGGTSQVAHDMAVQRLIQAGAVPVTWQQVLLEYQRDWPRRDTYDAVIDIVKEYSGAYGVGVEYAYTMVHGAPPSNEKASALAHA